MDKGKEQQQGNFLTGRQIARMICKNFRIIGESEAILEVGELMKVLINNDNAQSVNTRSDEVLSALTGRLGAYGKFCTCCSSTLRKIEICDARVQRRNRAVWRARRL